jgi:hypothetical protein
MRRVMLATAKHATAIEMGSAMNRPDVVLACCHANANPPMARIAAMISSRFRMVSSPS